MELLLRSRTDSQGPAGKPQPVAVHRPVQVLPEVAGLINVKQLDHAAQLERPEHSLSRAERRELTIITSAAIQQPRWGGSTSRISFPELPLPLHQFTAYAQAA
jgi:hypothetical protein